MRSLAGAVVSVFALGAALAGDARAAASEASGYSVYVTNEAAGTLSIIDGPGQSVRATYPVGARPRGLRLGLDGRSLYIPLSGARPTPPGLPEAPRTPADRASDGIAVFDLVERRVIRTLRGVPDPEQLALGGDGKVYVVSEEASALFVLDGDSGETLSQVAVGARPEGVALSRDGRWVYVTSEAENSVTVVDTTTDRAVKTIPVGARPRTVAFSIDGLRAYVPGEMDRSVVVIDTETQTVVSRVVLPGEAYLPMDVIVSPDDQWIYVSTGRGGAVVKLEARGLVGFDSVEVGGRPWGMALSPDGARLYAATGPADNVAVIDTASMTRIGTIPADGGPWGVVVAPLVEAE
jgi:YVTN family beta-propeller protein